MNRRSFLANTIGATASVALASGQKKSVPIGLEMYSVRGEMGKDLMGSVRTVAKMGYQVMEFYAPYYNWTSDQIKDVRKLMDDLGVRCMSTHNSLTNYKPENIQKAIDYNKALGARYIVIASAGQPSTLDGWKKTADALAAGADLLRPAGLRGGYHNHQAEFTPVEGKRPIEVIAANTPKDFMLQLDLGTCVEMGSDPVAWINSNPGRINSMHLKDWSKAEGYKVLFGEGSVPFKAVLEAGEKTGGVEYYLIEQEGSRFSEFESAERCLALYKKLRSA
jgi:sugar phosphate isomerase/epimerase